MKKTGLLICAVALTFLAEAQSITPSGSSNNNYFRNGDSSKIKGIKEKLVQLAMQNPEYEIADRNTVIAFNDLQKTKYRILSQINVQGNYNEFSNRKDVNGLSYYPRYNAGVNLPFDLFYTRKKDMVIGKEKLGIAEAEKNQKYREIREKVLSLYEDYLLLKAKLEFQSQITQDSYTTYLQAEKDFSDGVLKQEEYGRSYRTWVSEQIAKIDAQRNFNVVKLQIETMIGVSIDEVVAQYK